MNGQISVRTVLLIIVGIATGCLACRMPGLGVALMVSVRVVGLLHVLTEERRGGGSPDSRERVRLTQRQHPAGGTIW
ncbi:hypothetical protein ACFV83_37290, partial [Streptomyces pharetrae]|uniref:hypothetical protein n=1 Tax=Streptomyces pharetrae TaxID=291370 RepID=UPI00365C3FC1